MSERVENMIRDNINEALEQADELLKKAANASDEINSCVHENPWRAVGIAAAAGVLLGLLIAKK